MLAHTFATNIISEKLKHLNPTNLTIRDANKCIFQSQTRGFGSYIAPIITTHRNHRTNVATLKHLARDSLPAQSCSNAPQQRSYHPLMALSSAIGIVILGICTHIRQTLLGLSTIERIYKRSASPRGTSWHLTTFYLIRPFS